MQDVSAGAWGGYTAVLSCIVGAAILKESHAYLQLPLPGLQTGGEGEDAPLQEVALASVKAV